MTVPISGPITMGKIYQEVDGSGYSTAADPNEVTTLANLVGGVPDVLNQNSTSKPNTSTPHSMSEWRGYDHDAAPAFSWGTPNTFPNTFFDAEMETQDGSRSQVATVMKITHGSGQVNYQAIDMGRNFAPSGSTAGLNTDSVRSVSYTGTLSALFIQYVFTSIDNTIVQDSNDCVAEIRKDTNSSPNEPDASGYSLVQTLSTGTNQNITGTITQIGHTGTSAYWVMIETGSSGGTDTDNIRLRNGTVACKLYANSTTGPSVTLFTGKTVDLLASSGDEGS
jgi:hypothetical protein